MTSRRSEPPLREARYRSKEEGETADLLSAAGIEFEYEGSVIPYAVPARTAKYTPDFRVGNIILEYKGRFATGATVRKGNHFFTATGDGAKERKKLILVKEQHPELDIRLIFSRPGAKLSKHSSTTYADWADKYGFLWTKKNELPLMWIEDLKKEMRKCKTS